MQMMIDIRWYSEAGGNFFLAPNRCHTLENGFAAL